VILTDVMDEIADSVSSVDGLRVAAHDTDTVNPPQALVRWPDPIRYDVTMGRGTDSQELEVFVLTGRTDSRTARKLLGPYLNGSGAKSIKQAIDGGTYTACDSVTVTEGRVEAIDVSGVLYLAAVFTVSIVGSGS
jgi:hypothetical protein